MAGSKADWTETAVVTNVQGFSLHDGPGIRTVVFFKGCPLRCRWCANPECIAPEPQIGFMRHLCARCDRCVPVCPYYALRATPAPIDNTNDNNDFHRIDYSLCRACGHCVEVCGYGALTRYGETMSVEAVWNAVHRDRAFYDSSGGGITVSGGEPLVHAGFVRKLFELCKNDDAGRIDTCVETCGFVTRAALLAVLPVTDHFLFDLKHPDSRAHEEYTGQPNRLILENAALLLERGADVLFRQPLLAGVNDAPENIAATAEFLRKIAGSGAGGRARLEIMPYHRMGQGKYRALGLKYPLEDMPADGTSAAEAARAAYQALGIHCVISR